MFMSNHYLIIMCAIILIRFMQLCRVFYVIQSVLDPVLILRPTTVCF